MAISVATQTEHDALAARVQDLETQVQVLLHQVSAQQIALEEQNKRVMALLTFRETAERKIAQQSATIAALTQQLAVELDQVRKRLTALEPSPE